MSNITTYAHPFKQGVINLLGQHFAPEIVKNFKLAFESETFDKKIAQNILNQIRDDKLVMEVYYTTDKSLEYVCDLFSWETKLNTELRLLRYITDAIRAGKFGSKWLQNNDGRISEGIVSGKHETPEEKGGAN